jgi:hypothetical protein
MYIKEQLTGIAIAVEVIEAFRQDLPFKKDGWKFNWRIEFNKPDNKVYVVRQLDKHDHDIEAIISIKTVDEYGPLFKHWFLDAIEVAPHNFGSKGKYDRPAGILMAYACELAYTIESNYKGCALFQAKDNLVDLYIDKYGARARNLPLMSFEPPVSTELMGEYLN